jgi:hypothetical protein
MKKTVLSAAVVAASLLAACSYAPEEGLQDIQLNTSISSSETRVATDANGSESFVDGDAISVYGWTGEENSSKVNAGTMVVNGVKNTLTSGSWVAETQMLWFNPTEKHYFLSIFPARTVKDFTADEFTLTTPSVADNDLLIAKNLTGLVAAQKVVSLNFNHAMAKLIVNLSYRNQWGDTPTVSSVNVEAQTTGTIDYLAAAPVTATGTASNFALVADSENLIYSSIMVPQETLKTITVTIDGTTFTYNSESAISLKSGYVTTVNLIVGRDELTAGTISINDWQTGDVINNGEAL